MSNQLFLKPVQTLSGLLITCFIVALTISFAMFPVQANAQDYYQNRGIGAGIYLQIPFGPTKRNDDRLKYGLRLNMTQEFSNRPRWNAGSLIRGRQYVDMDLMSLNFSENGFRDMSFVGRRTLVYRDGVLRAARDDEDSMSGGKITFLIGALVGVGFIVTAVAEKK